MNRAIFNHGLSKELCWYSPDSAENSYNNMTPTETYFHQEENRKEGIIFEIGTKM